MLTHDLEFVKVNGNHLYIDLSVLIDRATGSPGRLIIAPVSEVKGEADLRGADSSLMDRPFSGRQVTR